MGKAWNRWTPGEVAKVRSHPEMTARELSEMLPRHSEAAIRQMRSRMGRYSRKAVPVCRMCDSRPVWAESPHARRYGLCKGCFLDEERRRLEDKARAEALRQQRHRMRRARGAGPS